MARLPTPGGDDNTWGTVLNDYLSIEHNASGSLKIRSDGTLSALAKNGANSDITSLSGLTTPLSTGQGGTGNGLGKAKVDVSKGGVVTGTRSQLNFVQGSNVTLTVADDSANGKVDITIAASAGTTNQLATFTQAGVLGITTSAMRYLFPITATLIGVSAIVGTAPAGASIIIDVNKNGSTIFTTQANRPTIAAGSTVSSEAAPDVTAVSAGDYLTVDIDQIGSTTPGSDLTVQIRYLM